MKNSEILKAIGQFGTPSFVFDIDMLHERVDAVRNILDETMKDTGRRIGLCYSVKANPFLVPFLDGMVDSFEVCSPGELEIAKHYGAVPKSIIYSGVNKDFEDVREAVDYNVGVITAESKRHFEIIKKAAEVSGRSVNVILRLTSGNQFGMSEEDIRDILNGGPYEKIGIIGIHYFAGTQRNTPRPQERDLKKLEGLMAQLRNDSGCELKKLEYGPGLPYPYFVKDDFSDTLKPLKSIAECLKTAAIDSELTVEMGRFIASSCGYYMTKICDIKRSEGLNWCILDGGLNHVNYYGQMMGMKCPVIRHLSCKNPQRSEEAFNKAAVEIAAAGCKRDADLMREEDMRACEKYEKYDLCGSLCTSNDILVREMELCDPAVGDVLAFENIGAYSITEGIGLFLSRDMAKVAVYENGKYLLLRDKVSTWKINSGSNLRSIR